MRRRWVRWRRRRKRGASETVETATEYRPWLVVSRRSESARDGSWGDRLVLLARSLVWQRRDDTVDSAQNCNTCMRACISCATIVKSARISLRLTSRVDADSKRIYIYENRLARTGSSYVFNCELYKTRSWLNPD